jgi:predicted dehydrogenase/threonine dehydrogenase-like Zn-dependent dehydrogenase
MKQILQSFKTGETFLEELPVPNVNTGEVLIQTKCSLVSLGTEKMLIEFGRSSLANKARQQPEKVKEVLEKIKSEGLFPTIEAVFNKLGQPIPLGYCNMGTVLNVGDGVIGFSVGDRVCSNGPHAEVISVPQNLVCKIPDEVSDEDASFTVIGSIGLQGVRLISPALGETIVVIGLGLIGLITCQLLKANGVKVLGIDLDSKKCDIAKKLGITTLNSNLDNIIEVALGKTNGIGVDGVIITASTKSNDVISQAANMCRKKGRIILIGVVGLNINRADFYEKELTFQVSCSYGPGRYDPQYEQKGIDYPIQYVRWTEKRNFQSILELIKSGDLGFKELISERVSLQDFNKIYDNIGDDKSIASLLLYPGLQKKELEMKTISYREFFFQSQKGIFGIIGAGNFTDRTMLPILKNTEAYLKYIASQSGVSSTKLAKKYHIENSTTDYKEVLCNSDIDTVIITTRHNTHAKITIESLEAGKNVFVEKPLALNLSELKKIHVTLINNKSLFLMVGFNRRFSPHIEKVKQSLGSNNNSINIVNTMNAGSLTSGHWSKSLDEGGGRIIGEACHLIDVCVYLTGSLVKSVCMNSLGTETDFSTDNASLLLKFENGSNAVINYFSNGSKKYSKERVEIFSQKSTWIIDNYRKTEAFGVKNFKTLKTKIDKGHEKQFQKLVLRVKNGGKTLIPFQELMNVTKASFCALESLKKNKWIKLDKN